jgi:hypothetical protein
MTNTTSTGAMAAMADSAHRDSLAKAKAHRSTRKRP